MRKKELIDLVGTNIRNKIRELGCLWRLSERNLRISKDVLTSWNRLIEEWIEDETMPLIVRKNSQRGREFIHLSGRKIIVSDNTFAVWIYHNALNGKTFDIPEIKSKLNNNEIPMVYALSVEEKKFAKYTKTLGISSLSDSETKWKLCHIEPVGLKTRKSLDSLDINDIVESFKRFANPMNMFILPKEIGGLGEVQEFIDEQTYKD